MNKNFSLDKIVYTFTQEPNTAGTTKKDVGEIETLEITVDTQLYGLEEKKGGFLVLRTRGWSIDSDFEEFKELLKIIQEGVGA